MKPAEKQMTFQNSTNENSFHEKTNFPIEQYVEYFAELWQNSTSPMPAFDTPHSKDDKLTNENEIERLYNVFRKSKKKFSDYSDEGTLKNDRFFKSAKKFLIYRMGLSKNLFDILSSNGFYQVTNEFIKKARKFDPMLSSKDLFQAIRNVWTMNWLQLLLGLKIELTPSVFAYSMLYPYTDNYLDDPAVSSQDKSLFNLRLTERLNGKQVKTANPREQVIHSLISIIESQFNKADHPGVYKSLLAIHSAQEKSLLLSDPGRFLSHNETLQISIEKGGTSVLADGFLVSGNLTEEQMLFLFGYGAYLQLVDDLQDMQEDSKAGCSTVFLQASGGNRLDAMVNQTYNFGSKVMSYCCLPEEENLEPVFSLMQKSSKLLLIEAIGQSNGFFSSSFISRVEKYSPVHFPFFRKHKKSLQHLALSFLE